MNEHDHDSPQWADEHGYDGPSKSQRKRDSAAQQALGEALVALSAQQLAHIELPEELREAVIEAQRIQQRGAHKRQLQFIGRLMRSVDTAPIETALQELRGHGARAAAQLHHIEHWRDRLLEQGDEALQALLLDYPEADRQQLRQWQRNARQERKANKPPHSSRALFRYLRDLIDAEE